MSNMYDVSVTNKVKIAEKTWEITFKIDDVDFFFCAGQYVWVINPHGRRAFSIASSSFDQSHIKIIFRENEMSQFKKYLLSSDIDIKISDSRGLLRVPSYERTIYICGGVGIAPVVSILRTMVDKKITKKIYLYFINVEKSKEFYIEELEKIKKDNSWFNFKNIIAEEVEFKKLSKESKYIVFGSPNFVDMIYKNLQKNNISEKNIIFEENYPSPKLKVELSHQENVFKTAVDSSTSHTIITDINGKILYANKQAEITTGYTLEEMKDQTPRLWGGLMDKDEYLNFWKTLKVDKKVYKGTLKNIRKNGEIYYVNTIVTPILDKDSNILGFIGNENDITTEKTKQDQSENLNKLTIGRELKIIELKNKIKEIEDLKTK